MCTPPRKINVEEYQLIPKDKYHIISSHYKELKINSQIVKRIFEITKTYTPSVETCQIYYLLQEENKHDIRIYKKHDLSVFLSYFPLILDSIVKQDNHEIQSGRPRIIFVCNSPNEAIEIYCMVEKFVQGFNIRVVLSHQNRKMKLNKDYMRTPYTIFITTIQNLEYHLEHPSLYFNDCSYFIMINLESWKKNNNYSILVSLMITCGWSPRNKCSVIGISESTEYPTRDIFNHFSYKNYYDIGF